MIGQRPALLLLLALLPVLCAFGDGHASSSARRDADRFILEKLRRQSGEGWLRSGQFFLWTYRFSADGCELSVQREPVDGGVTITQILPMADVVPLWNGGGAIALVCQSTTDCIGLKTVGGDRDDSQPLGDTALLVPEPDDLPKLVDAFGELHRLCDDAYRRPDH